MWLVAVLLFNCGGEDKHHNVEKTLIHTIPLHTQAPPPPPPPPSEPISSMRDKTTQQKQKLDCVEEVLLEKPQTEICKRYISNLMK
jgi:hypothetical protein